MTIIILCLLNVYSSFVPNFLLTQIFVYSNLAVPRQDKYDDRALNIIPAFLYKSIVFVVCKVNMDIFARNASNCQARSVLKRGCLNELECMMILIY